MIECLAYVAMALRLWGDYRTTTEYSTLPLGPQNAGSELRSGPKGTGLVAATHRGPREATRPPLAHSLLHTPKSDRA
jgi:hypothetical protein